MTHTAQVLVDRDSAADIPTLYRLDGPVTESRGGGGGDIPHPAWQALGNTYPYMKRVPELFPCGESGRSVVLTTHRI
jgi:hypothetical protein